MNYPCVIAEDVCYGMWVIRAHDKLQSTFVSKLALHWNPGELPTHLDGLPLANFDIPLKDVGVHKA